MEGPVAGSQGAVCPWDAMGLFPGRDLITMDMAVHRHHRTQVLGRLCACRTGTLQEHAWPDECHWVSSPRQQIFAEKKKKKENKKLPKHYYSIVAWDVGGAILVPMQRTRCDVTVGRASIEGDPAPRRMAAWLASSCQGHCNFGKLVGGMDGRQKVTGRPPRRRDYATEARPSCDNLHPFPGWSRGYSIRY